MGIITKGNLKVVHVLVLMADVRLSVGIVARRRMDGQTDSVFDQRDVIDVWREEVAQGGLRDTKGQL